MIAGELAGFASESGRTIGDEERGLADTGRMAEPRARCGLTGRILIRFVERHLSERHPEGLAAPARVNELAAPRESSHECLHGARSSIGLEASQDDAGADADDDLWKVQGGCGMRDAGCGGRG